MIYRFRVILDVEDDVFRDIEIQEEATLEDFHNAITQAFGFDGSEMAAFYDSDDEWNQGDEYMLFDMGEDDVRKMSEIKLNEVASAQHDRLLYIYDFLSLWKFLVELMDIAEPDTAVLYPHLVQAHGLVPEEAPETFFESETGFDEDISLDDDDEDFDDFDDTSYGMSLN
ncbi:MAG: plasmid pRiA4b ORF-3 family protein [Bacteroidetes bacterium]|nr:plasmid pRiA4b ORF-3 family protein [Bacteroidota bacterium]